MLACKLNDFTDKLLDVCWQSSNSKYAYKKKQRHQAYMRENKFGGIYRNAGKNYERHLCRVPEIVSAASPACARK
jgi:hypothetical protein